MILAKKEDDKIIYTVDNGEVGKLEIIKDRFGFKDYESIMDYMIAILAATNRNAVGIVKADDSVEFMSPQKELLK
ncbi:MAG: hypothetical protein LBL52_01735 [Rickettsiales bacterium]|jgi:hypothetical protein|nr:hypothetical protein [Rickettsiales bacterium]